jgi:hypothetical protein
MIPCPAMATGSSGGSGGIPTTGAGTTRVRSDISCPLFPRDDAIASSVRSMTEFEVWVPPHSLGPEYCVS